MTIIHSEFSFSAIIKNFCLSINLDTKHDLEHMTACG